MEQLAILRRNWVMPLALACAWSCSESSSDSKSSEGGTMATVSLPNQLNIKSESLGLVKNARLLGNPLPNQELMTLQADAAATFGHSLADGIKALKYRISSMELCGYSDGSRGDACTERPFSIYTEDRSASNYDSFVPGSEAVSNFTGWTDFMKKGSLEELLNVA